MTRPVEYLSDPYRFRWALGDIGVPGEKGFNPNEPRDEAGRWTTGGGRHDSHDPKSTAEETRKKVPEHLVAAGKAWSASLTDDEKKGVSQYMGSFYDQMNTIARGGEGTAAFKKDVKRLISAMDKAPALEHEVVVYRGIDEVAAVKFDKYMNVNDRGFVSTSLSPHTAWGYSKRQSAVGAPEQHIVRITLPQGSKVAYLSHSRDPRTSENEVLLKNGTFLRVLGKGTRQQIGIELDGTPKMAVVHEALYVEDVTERRRKEKR